MYQLDFEFQAVLVNVLVSSVFIASLLPYLVSMIWLGIGIEDIQQNTAHRLVGFYFYSSNCIRFVNSNIQHGP